MTALAAEILPVSQSVLIVGFTVFLRVGAAMALLPAFGERSVPMRARFGIAAAFTFIVASAMFQQLVAIVPSPSAHLLATETIAGLSIGVMLRLFVIALQIAASIAAQSTSLSQLFGGATTEPLPAIGHLLVIAGLALAVGTGLHIKLAEMFVLSYHVIPVGTFPDVGKWTSWQVGHLSHMFGLAFALAAPFVAASFLYNITLGVINRAMPQLMVALVGAPAIAAGGLIILALASPFLLSLWLEALDAFLVAPFASI